MFSICHFSSSFFCFPFQPPIISFTRHRQYPPPLERAQEAKELWGKLGSCDEGHWVLTIAVWSWGNTVMAAWNRLLRGCKFVIFILGSKVAAKFKLTNIRLPTFVQSVKLMVATIWGGCQVQSASSYSMKGLEFIQYSPYYRAVPDSVWTVIINGIFLILMFPYFCFTSILVNDIVTIYSKK